MATLNTAMIAPEEIASLIRRIYLKLPEGTADLVIEDSGKDIRLTPRNPSSAAVAINIEGDMIYLTFGRTLNAEIMVASKPPFARELAIIQLIAMAAVNGIITEHVWECKGKLIASKGEFTLAGKKHRFYFNFLSRLLHRAVRQDYRYLPYDVGSVVEL